MCNVCATHANTHCGCGCSCGGFWNGFWNTQTQSICRDYCGNIRVNQASCGCNACSNTPVVNTVNANGCGRCRSNLSQLSGDAYYMRLYALGNPTANTTGCGGYTPYNGCGSCFGCCRSCYPNTWTVEDATDNT